MFRNPLPKRTKTTTLYINSKNNREKRQRDRETESKKNRDTERLKSRETARQKDSLRNSETERQKTNPAQAYIDCAVAYVAI